MKNWTVTVEGRERHDGENPYTYVIGAADKVAAGEAVVAHHKAQNNDDDVNLLEVLPGVPENARYHWNDLRHPVEPEVIEGVCGDPYCNGRACWECAAIRGGNPMDV